MKRESRPKVEAAPPWRADQRLQHLEWTVLRRLDGLLHGDWRTVFRGHGLDLAELREYQLHDDVRRIDWNVTARLNHPHVREHLEDREAAAWFLLDLSPSLDFGTHRRKRSVAADVAGVLASALTRKGHRIGAFMYGDGVELAMPARTGRTQVMALMQRIESHHQAPRLHLVKPARTSKLQQRATQLGDLIHAAHANIKGRSVVFVLSDFISTPGWDSALARMALRHDVVAVRIVDAAERDMPNMGLIPLVDLETGDSMLVDTGAPGFRQRYTKLQAEREHRVRELLAHTGVDTLELTTQEDLGGALLRFVRARRERARLTAGATALKPLRTHAQTPSERQA